MTLLHYVHSYGLGTLQGQPDPNHHLKYGVGLNSTQPMGELGLNLGLPNFNTVNNKWVQHNRDNWG